MRTVHRTQISGIFGLSAILAGCATAGTEPPVAGAGSCDSAVAQFLIGETATQELAVTAMERTGARELRWIPENSAVTMDYRPTRLNIEYDNDSSITAIRCG